MNSAVHGNLDGRTMRGNGRGNGRVLAGVGVSMAVHLLLMFAYRHAGPDLPVLQPESPSSIAVRILPPPPPESPPPEPSQSAPAPPQRAAPAVPRSARRSVPKPVIAVPASPQQETSPDPFLVQQPDQAASAAPSFDMNAARQTARQLAGQTRLGREGTALAQFPDPPLETETRAARAISRAKRPNCKDGLPGGLLAPLFLMMEKKDSGCKW